MNKEEIMSKHARKAIRKHKSKIFTPTSTHI